VATATVAKLRDLEYKVRRAMEFHGARYLHVLVPCPLGWGSASHDTVRIARLAKESGLFPVFKAEHSEMVSVAKIRRWVPVEDYLRPQARYKHLFGEHPRTNVIARIPAGDSARILDAVSVLRGAAGEQPPMLGRRVVVYGGGNTALDTARTAKRLGATDAVVVYRRTRERMPAHDIEVSQALEEGITVKWLSTITHADDATIKVSASPSAHAARSRWCKKTQRNRDLEGSACFFNRDILCSRMVEGSAAGFEACDRYPEW
jgi:Pyridine nucleotide-disulphide oxidoreductase